MDAPPAAAPRVAGSREAFDLPLARATMIVAMIARLDDYTEPHLGGRA